MRDEADLVRRAAAGDQGAFEELILSKRDRVYRTAWQVVRNAEDARDVSQQVFVKLWRVIRRFRPGRKFDTWLHRITVNCAIDHLRRRQPVMVELPGGEPPADSASPGRARQGGQAPWIGPESSSHSSPDAAIARSELRRVYETVAEKLTERQRLVFSLREVEGLSAEEIARALGVTASTIRNTLFQARAILREELKRQFPEYFPPEGSPGKPRT